MITNYTHTVTERFLRYVQIDTQSNPDSSSFPSSEKQKDLLSLLATELKAMGIVDAHMDEHGYVYATIAANTNKQVPVICFCSHADTTADCSGTNVKPIVHKNYNGQPIVLPDDATQIITTEKYPYLTAHIGATIITASGHTLLGADDKAGVAIIMDLVNYLQTHPEIKHGAIKILFTPDEETGRGCEKINLQKLGAQFAYTLDGGELGCFEDETFSANACNITIHGIMAHPGTAKGTMVNALKIAGEILAALPTTEWCPEATAGSEGFVHPISITGSAEKATIDFLIRDFDTAQLKTHQERLEKITADIVAKKAGASFTITVKEQYRNMKDIIDAHPQVSDYAKQAYSRCNIPFINEPIRGGTDGSKLSAMGLPCPNIFTGMQAIHSKHEWVGEKDMLAAVQVLVELVTVWEEKS
jgi:tripeptide aminopeptidase